MGDNGAALPDSLDLLPLDIDFDFDFDCNQVIAEDSRAVDELNKYCLELLEKELGAFVQPPPPPPLLGDIKVPANWDKMKSPDRDKLAVSLFGEAPYKFPDIPSLNDWFKRNGIKRNSSAYELIHKVRRTRMNCVYARNKRHRDSQTSVQDSKIRKLKKENAALRRQVAQLKEELASRE